jgi:hypothetical protein
MAKKVGTFNAEGNVLPLVSSYTLTELDKVLDFASLILFFVAHSFAMYTMGRTRGSTIQI